MSAPRTDEVSRPAPRVVLVTGGSSGIGAVTVARLLARGDTVVALSRSGREPAGVDSTTSGSLTAVTADMLDEGALAAVVDRIVAQHGRLDAVVHAAQVMAYGRIEDVPAATFERVVDTAIHGTANLARIVLPQFRVQRHGALVVVNSLLGQIATPRMGAYDVGKWGQLGLADVLRLEVRDVPGITVSTVSPGAINTPIYDQAANYAGRGGFPPPPVVDPDRVARAIERVLDRPRRHVNVGPVNVLTVLGFRTAPAVYDRIVGPLVDWFVFRGEDSDGNDGNVFTPAVRGEQARGRWSWAGRATRGAR